MTTISNLSTVLCETPVVQALLKQHEQQRQNGQSRISALVGPAGLAAAEVRKFAGPSGRKVVLAECDDADVALRRWCDHLLANEDLANRSRQFLARRLGFDLDEIDQVLAGERKELCQFLDQRLPIEISNGPEALVRRLLLGDASEPGGLVGDAGANLRDFVGAIVPVYSQGESPVLALSLADNADAKAIVRAAESLVTLATDCPDFTVVLLFSPAGYQRFQANATNSYGRGIIEDGTIHLRPLDANKVAQWLAPYISNPDDCKKRSEQLASLGVSEQTVKKYVESLRVFQESVEKARSSQEGLLFTILEEMPDTAGLFALNVKPGFKFGNQEAELDLACQSLKIAIEIDGYYHFQSLDNYRRDRKKDFELQSRGYLVVRFLAEDVAQQFEKMLTTIREAIAVRQQDPRG